MSAHYIVTLDHGHLRIFEEQLPAGQTTPALQQVEAMDFPLGRASYSDRETDAAGRWRFASSQGQAAGAGGSTARPGRSIDERLPMPREELRRRAKELAAEIDAFFRDRPEATWDFAAGPELNGAVLALISPEVRQHVRRSVAKDLVHQRLDEVRAHFAGI